MPHEPMMSAERARMIRAWQDAVFESEMARTDDTRVEYLGLTLMIPPHVHVFDPPFRWFAPRDLRERNTTDENYETLTAFFRDVGRYLNPEGRILLFFGTSGDAEYVHALIRREGFDAERLRSRHLEKDGLDVEYFTYRLTQST